MNTVIEGEAAAQLREAEEVYSQWQQAIDVLTEEMDSPDSPLSEADIEREMGIAQQELEQARHRVIAARARAKLYD